MKAISISLPEGRSHRIMIGGKLGDLGRAVAKLVDGRRALVVSVAPVANIYGKQLLNGLVRAGFEARLATFPDGEKHKTLATAARLYRQALAAGLDRRSVVIALGGGVVGDVAGFVAATYMRGVAFVQCPTTLLAMVDASIGGKTGVDLDEGKNLVGAFWQPRLVWMDVSTLRTLPPRQWRTGMAEVIKYGMMADPGLWNRLEKIDPAAFFRRLDLCTWVVARSAAIKARVVSADDKEQTGLRATLNLGHTFAHAIETVAGYGRYTHGEAVAIGLCAAARLGARRGTFRTRDVARVDAMVTRWGLPARVRRPLSRAAILAAMARDKKAVGGQFRFVLPVGIGHAQVGAATPSEVEETLDEVGI